MKIELLEILPLSLRIGDQWHDDDKVPNGEESSRFVHSDTGVLWTVINQPIDSTNAQLFWDAPYPHHCIVVPVKYLDGARGSRLFDPEQRLIIRRDTEQKAI